MTDSTSNASHASTRPYWTTAIALFVLLSLSIVTAWVHLGPATTVVALAIAAIKVTLVATRFMHLNMGGATMRLFAAAGMFWLAILMGLTLADYATRY